MDVMFITKKPKSMLAGPTWWRKVSPGLGIKRAPGWQLPHITEQSKVSQATPLILFISLRNNMPHYVHSAIVETKEYQKYEKSLKTKWLPKCEELVTAALLPIDTSIEVPVGYSGCHPAGLWSTVMRWYLQQISFAVFWVSPQWLSGRTDKDAEV